MKHVVVAIGLLFVFAAQAGGIVIRHDREDARYRALAEEHGDLPVAYLGAAGAGTLIDAQWVLTAGHVAEGLLPFGAEVEIGETRARMAGVAIHPVHDVALVRLAEPVDGISPIPLHRDDDEVGREILLIGRGDTGSGRSGPTGNDGRIRAAWNRVEGTMGRAVLVFSFDEGEAALDLEGISGPGDSGGPALLAREGGWALAGVSSSNDGNPPGRYGSTEFYVRSSAVAEWIDATIADGAVEALPASESVDAGWPDAAAGAVAAAYFEAMAAFDRDAIAAFERAHRSAAALAQRGPEERADRWLELSDMIAGMRPERWALDSDGQLSVLAIRAGGRRIQLRFLMDEVEPSRLHTVQLIPL